MMRGLAIALAISPPPALACVPLPEPASQAELDARLRTEFSGSIDLIDYVVVRRVNRNHIGTIRVLRSYKGRVAAGTVLRVETDTPGMCGIGEARRGMRSRMFLRGKEPYWIGIISDETYDEFARLGLVPAR
jgi:hypothetical protein